MKSLNLFSKAFSKFVFAVAIISTFAVAMSAQKVDPQQQGKMYGEPGFRGEPIELNVVNADIRDILSYITDQYGINFVIDRSVKEVPVTVKVKDVPWNIALDSVLQAQELGVQVNGNILRVADNKTLASEGELVKQRQNNQLDSTPLYTEKFRLNYATVSVGTTPSATTAGTSTGGGGGGGGGGMTGGGGGGDASGGAGGASQNQGLLPIIKRRLSRRGSVEIDARTNSLIVTDVASNLGAIKQLVAMLDQPEPQVEIEARIVVASRNFSRDIGVQLSALLTGARGSGIGGGTLPNTPVGLPNTGLIPNPTINNDLASRIANTAIGLTTGVFGTAQLSAIISLGEQKGQAKVIATPRVTALNNEPAEIKSSTKIPIRTIQPGTGAGGNAIFTTEYVDVPLRLSITPQITDQGTVILTVTAENSSTAIATGADSAPAINTQSMTTKVVVPDGGTTVVGGVLFDDERESQDRTPGLGSIPILGNLFKRKGVTRNTNEVLFFITPRITRQDFAGGVPATGAILQPVPLGNPPSNSSTETPVLPSPGMERPQPAATPIKP